MQAILYAIVQAVYNARYHPLAGFPAPLLARISLVSLIQSMFMGAYYISPSFGDSCIL